MLQINSAEIDETDEEKKTVIISTEDQELNVNYKLTVSISVKDKAGNPIVSGTADTGSFKGTDTEKGEPVNTDGPVIVEIEALNDRTFLVTFNETIVLGINPEANFKLALKEASKLPQAKKPILSALISAARLKLRIFSFNLLFSSF